MRVGYRSNRASGKSTQPNKACTGLVGTVRLFEHFQRPEHFSARRASQRLAHKPVTQSVGQLSLKRRKNGGRNQNKLMA